MKEQLGRLKRVPLRECWADESNNFTPWLASEENIELLGDAIGIELLVEGVDVRSGRSRRTSSVGTQLQGTSF